MPHGGSLHEPTDATDVTDVTESPGGRHASTTPERDSAGAGRLLGRSNG